MTKQTELTKGLDYDETVKKLTSIDRKTGKESFLSYVGLSQQLDHWKREIDILNKWYKNGSTPIVETQHRPGLEENKKDQLVNASKVDYYNKTLAKYTKQLNEAEKSLKSTLLFDIHPQAKELYKYGSSWLTVNLPEDFEDDLNNLMDDIEAEEEEKTDRKVTDEDIELFEDFNEPETALALALVLDLSINEIDEIEENNDYRWTVQGVDYLAGTDEEMDEAWDDDLENYIDECLEIPKEMENYFDREAWKDDAKMDGRGHSLNRYDGGEEEININGVYYFMYRN